VIRAGLAFLLGAATLSAAWQVDVALPASEARAMAPPTAAPYLRPDGAIAVVGYNDMAEMMVALTARFGELHAGFRFALDLPGTKAGPAALAEGRAAFAPMGAAFTPAQLAAYRVAAGGDPLEICVAGGSLDAKALSGPLAVIVAAANSATEISLSELAAVFSAEVPPGDWRPCGVAADAPLALLFRERILGGGDFGPRYAGLPRSGDVVARVAADPRAIGFTRANALTPAVKALALFPAAGRPAVALTAENLAAGRYPLDWHLRFALRRPVEAWVREFVRFALSRDGQEIIARGAAGYRPLSAAEAAREREKLP
jgi:phosphate transport system substrate-binding protein